MKTPVVVFSLIVLILTACAPDETIQPIQQNGLFEQGCFILNEGGFGHQNASIDFYDYTADSLYKSVFSTQNGYGIGDVLQSSLSLGPDYYFVVNNSSKLVRTDSNLQVIHEVEQIQSPRYIAPYGDKLFVSDLFAKEIHIVDPNLGVKTNAIPTASWTEGIIVWDDYLLVCQPTANQVLLIDANTNSKLDSIELEGQPSFIVKDEGNDFWVLGSGDYTGIEWSHLGKLQVENQTLNIIFNESIGDVAGLFPKLAYNQADQLLYLAIGNTIYTQPTASNSLDLSMVFESTAQSVYNIAYNPHEKEILVADAKDYVQNGTIWRHSTNGQLVGQLQVGIIPNGVLCID